jgi:hypothetical protein
LKQQALLCMTNLKNLPEKTTQKTNP